MIHIVSGSTLKGFDLGTHVIETFKRSGLPFSFGKKEDPAPYKPDLVIKVDDGDVDQFAYNQNYKCPTAWWFIDPHTVFERGLEISQNFDLVFCAQKDGTERLKSCNIDAEWLPCAADPMKHTCLEPLQSRLYDVGFAGSIHSNWSGQRKEILSHILKTFSNPASRKKCMFGEPNAGQISMINGNSRVVINHCVNNDINMRYFEAIMSGAILVTPQINKNGYDEFKKFDSIIEYDGTKEDAIDKITFALDSAPDLQQSTMDAQEHYSQRHTYHNRISQILGRAFKS